MRREGTSRATYRGVCLAIVLSLALFSFAPTVRAGLGVWTMVDLTGMRIESLAADPTDPTILFAGTNGNGIFRSTDGGQTWTGVNNGLANLFVNAITVNPTNPGVILAATGRGAAVGEETAGIYRSTDRGETWTRQSPGFANAFGVDPTNAGIIYAAGAPPVRKTTDGGITWSLSFGGIENTDLTGIAVNAENTSNILAGGVTEGGTGKIFRSTNAGGAWTLVLDGLDPVFDVAFAPPAAPGAVAFFAGLIGVFRSGDAGLTWTRVSEELGDVAVRDILPNPLDAKIVFGATQNEGVIRSTDGGVNWITMNDSLGNRDVFSLTVDRAAPQTLYAGTADGPWAFTFAALPALTLSPTSGPPGTEVRFVGSGFTPGGRVTVAMVQGLGIIVAEVVADPSGGIRGSFVMPSPQLAGELRFGPVDVFAIDRATAQETPPASFILTELAPPVTTLFFAEGATAPPFDTWFLVQNPGPNQATLTFTFQLAGGGTTVRTFTARPTSRFSLLANHILPNQAFSTRIDADQPVLAERAMYVSFDGDDVIGISSPARLWLFAEGATVTPFHTWLLLQNPNAQNATATITYVLEGGGTETQAIELPAGSRTSIFVNQVLPDAAFSTRVESDLPIIVERAMYRFPGNAATVVPGVQSASPTWFFAEGGTLALGRPADTWLLIQNPNDSSVSADITIYDTAGNTSTITQTLAPTSRLGVFLNLFTDLSSFGVRLDASAPVIAERSIFFGTEPKGATTTIGSPELASVWNFAEGSTAPPFTEIISLLNPLDQNMRVTMEFFLEGGETVVRQFTVGPNRKLSVTVNDIVPDVANSARVSTTIPTVVERAMYFVKNGDLGGHDTIGAR
ncbi:MAG: hypothetical protein HYY30_05430 [Chloroflexi bacterium]|nr:hypothetical protein [Chloroflexota bacterium]